MVHKSCLIVLTLLLLSSCARQVEITTTPAVTTSIAKPSRPAAIELEGITWKVLNIDDNVYYGISVPDYEILALNMLEIKRYVQEQQNIISYYEEVVD